MNIYTISITLLILFALKNKIKFKKVLFIKNLFFPSIILVFMLCLVLFPHIALNSALKGMNLWLNIILPSLLPFLVCAEIINKTILIKIISIIFEPIMEVLFNISGYGALPLLLGMISGYPVGAKITTNLRQNKILSKYESERLIAFTNNSSPLFILSAVAIGMLNSPKSGVILLTAQTLASLTVGILFRFYKKNELIVKGSEHIGIIKKIHYELSKKQSNKNFSLLLAESINSSIMTILSIGSLIIMFSVLINILLETGIINFISAFISKILYPMHTNKYIIDSICCGFIEISTGTNMASTIYISSFALKLSIISLIIGWSGLSVHFQVFGIISSTDLSIKPYILGKILQSSIAAIYTYLLSLPYMDYLSSSLLTLITSIASPNIISTLFKMLSEYSLVPNLISLAVF